MAILPALVTVPSVRAGGLSAGAKLLSQMLGYWQPKNGSETEIPNSGSEPAFKVTGSGFRKVEGPAIWCSRDVNNYLETADVGLAGADDFVIEFGGIFSGPPFTGPLFNQWVGAAPGDSLAYLILNDNGVVAWGISDGTTTQTGDTFFTSIEDGTLGIRLKSDNGNIIVEFTEDGVNWTEESNDPRTVGNLNSSPTAVPYFIGDGGTSNVECVLHTIDIIADGVLTWQLTRANIAQAGQNSTNIVAQVSPTDGLTINSPDGSSGCNQVVPKGVEYANPDASLSTKYLFENSSPIDVLATEDYLFACVLRGNDTPTVFENVSNMHTNTVQGIRFASNAGAKFVNSSSQANLNPAPTTVTNRISVCYVVHLSRDNSEVRMWAIGQPNPDNSVAVADQGNVVTVEASPFHFRYVHGGMAGPFAWHKGVALNYTDDDIHDIAAELLSQVGTPQVVVQGRSKRTRIASVDAEPLEGTILSVLPVGSGGFALSIDCTDNGQEDILVNVTPAQLGYINDNGILYVTINLDADPEPEIIIPL